MAALAACGGGHTTLSDAECARWADLWVHGPGGVGDFGDPDLARDLRSQMLQTCQRGEVSRAEYDCALAAHDEVAFARCADDGSPASPATR